MKNKDNGPMSKLEKFDARGLQTLFRNLSRNHYNLLKMVDNKASILLTINSIIISFLMGAMYLAPETQKEIIQSGFRLLMRFCFGSMITALLSMLPHRYFGKTFKRSTYEGLLYSQNFSRLTIEEYRTKMRRVMENGENLYSEMIDDLYFLGKAISVKQRLLVLSFIIFIVGLIIVGLKTSFQVI